MPFFRHVHHFILQPCSLQRITLKNKTKQNLKQKHTKVDLLIITSVKLNGNHTISVSSGGGLNGVYIFELCVQLMIIILKQSRSANIFCRLASVFFFVCLFVFYLRLFACISFNLDFVLFCFVLFCFVFWLLVSCLFVCSGCLFHHYFFSKTNLLENNKHP